MQANLAEGKVSGRGIEGNKQQEKSIVKVAVIGCGPAGLAAAHAAVGRKAEVVVFAPKSKTPQYGPLLIQRPIPGINTNHPDGTIHQIVIGGSITDYRYKLYGDINIGINGDILQPCYHAWKHRETYDKLWDMYESIIESWILSPSELGYLHQSFDFVVSTANASTLCRNRQNHVFSSKPVAVTPETSYPDQPDNTIIFNANPEAPWVRSSRVFGVPVTEWPVKNAPSRARTIWKPIATNCDCYPNVLRTGRFGAYRNETWIDTAYWDTYNAMAMRDSEDIRRISDNSKL